jgi:hypothetical protein
MIETTPVPSLHEGIFAGRGITSHRAFLLPEDRASSAVRMGRPCTWDIAPTRASDLIAARGHPARAVLARCGVAYV